MDIRGFGLTDLHDRSNPVVRQETRNGAPLKYEVLPDGFVRPNTRKSQNKYIVQIDLQSDYTALILISGKELCANMIK